MPYVKPKTQTMRKDGSEEGQGEGEPFHIDYKVGKEKINEDLLTPRPLDSHTTSTLNPSHNSSSSLQSSGSTNMPSLDTLSSTLESTHIAKEEPIPNEMPVPSSSTTSLTSLSTDHSVNGETTASESSEINTPPTSAGGAGTPDIATIRDVVGEMEVDPVMRYKEGLYAYTRALYLEAKLSQGKKASTPYSQFGLKQSGMEKLAAKKALARQLNA